LEVGSLLKNNRLKQSFYFVFLAQISDTFAFIT
jgi:hypothetical protein